MWVTVRIVIALVAVGGVVVVLPFVLTRGGSYPVAVAVALAAGYVLIAGASHVAVGWFFAARHEDGRIASCENYIRQYAEYEERYFEKE